MKDVTVEMDEAVLRRPVPDFDPLKPDENVWINIGFGGMLPEGSYKALSWLSFEFLYSDKAILSGNFSVEISTNS